VLQAWAAASSPVAINADMTTILAHLMVMRIRHPGQSGLTLPPSLLQRADEVIH